MARRRMTAGQISAANQLSSVVRWLLATAVSALPNLNSIKKGIRMNSKRIRPLVKWEDRLPSIILFKTGGGLHMQEALRAQAKMAVIERAKF